MRISVFLIFGLLCWQTASPAQTIQDGDGPDDVRAANFTKTGVVGAASATNLPSYAPQTASERWSSYFLSAFGPGAILRAAASGGITQWSNSPKEWKQGSEAFGERVGNSFAEHVIRKSLEAGGGAILHEDNRYFRSTESGFLKRTRHAVFSAFVARNEAGREHFAYSRIGSSAATSFISRAWQPPSETTSGDAAVNFGITMAINIGSNVIKEFRPARFGRAR